ncbi:hypothetical protein [Mucilaginibacter sp. 3215]|uniref:hypothetical protein n=1 Tax=Mucilaginibacter sp. 3215 TaxID=3373912 RepID=UPI003D1992B3
MKSKEEILNSYNTTGKDGLPEISAEDLLNAMEAYKQQWAEAAFNAARKQCNEAYEFETFNDFMTSTQAKEQVQDDFGAMITAVADNVVANFLPDDSSINEFDFNFTMQGKGYTAFYAKDARGYWQMSRWAEQ